MIPIEHFREQQRQARLLAHRILAAVDRHVPGEDSTLMVLDVARLSGMLVVHCGQVDRVLTSRVEQQPSHATRVASYRYRQEFGGLVDLSRLFQRRWSTSNAIARDPVAFRIDVHHFVQAIEERFSSEQALLHEPGEQCAASALVEPPLGSPIRAVG